MISKSKNEVFRKCIKWELVGNMVSMLVIMALCLLLSSGIQLAVILAASLIFLFSLIILLYFGGVAFYQLTLSDTCIIEKIFLKKTTSYNWSDFKKIQVSLDQNIIILHGDNICLSLRSIKHANRLYASLNKRLGKGEIEISHQIK